MKYATIALLGATVQASNRRVRMVKAALYEYYPTDEVYYGNDDVYYYDDEEDMKMGSDDEDEDFSDDEDSSNSDDSSDEDDDSSDEDDDYYGMEDGYYGEGADYSYYSYYDWDNMCPNMDDEENLDDFEFIRMMHRTVFEGFYQGWYNTRDSMLPQKCFGDWMTPMSENFMDVADKLDDGDIWGISHDQVRDAMNDSLDMFFVNLDECQMYRYAYNNYQWCMENPGVCFQMDGFLERMVNSAFPLATSAYDIYKLVTVDDTCFSDTELLGELKRGIRDFAEIGSAIVGFQGDWDIDADFEQLSFGEMSDNLWDSYDDLMEEREDEDEDDEESRCPIQGFFEDFFGEPQEMEWNAPPMPWDGLF